MHINLVLRSNYGNILACSLIHPSMNIVLVEIRANTSEASPMARHSAPQETEQQLPTPKSPSRLVRFMRSGAFIWVVELLILVAIGIAVYNDWDTPIRDQGFMPISYTVTYDMQNFNDAVKYLKAASKYNYYDKYEVNEKDLSCTSQGTNGNIEVTLITCASAKKKRLVVKCRAIT